MLKHSLQEIAPPIPLLSMLVVLGIVTGALIWLTSQRHDQRADIRHSEFSSQSKGRVFYPTAEQWATLTVEPVQQRVFQSQHVTEGKIAVDEDRSTPIFSPYAGRVLKLFVKPGDTVTVGQPLFTVLCAQNPWACQVQKRGSCGQNGANGKFRSIGALLDHLVGAGEQRHLRGPEVDN